MRRLVLLALVGLARSSSTARSAWGTASRRRRCWSRPGIAPAAASAAIHFSELGTTLVSGISHHKLGNTDWRTVGVLAAARLRRCLRRRDAAGQPRHRRRRTCRRGPAHRARHVRHLPVPDAAPAARSDRGPAPASSRRSACSAAPSTRSVAAAGVRSARRRCSRPAGSSRARWSARSTPPSSSSRSAARSASWSAWARRASSGRYVARADGRRRGGRPDRGAARPATCRPGCSASPPAA